MQPLSIILIGRSGAGKGTQAKMLADYFKAQSQPVYHLETGAHFREFIQGTSFSSQRSKVYYDANRLQPDFLSVWVWADLLVSKLSGNEHIIFDGVPRKKDEARVLDTAFEFYERSKVVCVHIDVTDATVIKRLRERGRMDDMNDADIQKRLAWFETDVQPTIDYYKDAAVSAGAGSAGTGRYEYVRIDGEQSSDAVFDSIKKALAI